MEYLMKKLQFKGEPKFIDVATSAMAEGLKEGVIECGATEKVCIDPQTPSVLAIIYFRVLPC